MILEDIIDSGLTLKFVAEHLRSMEPASLKICTLLDKPERRKVDIFADYVGFTIPNEFVVGFGLDYQEFYRNLPFIGVLEAGGLFQITKEHGFFEKNSEITSAS